MSDLILLGTRKGTVSVDRARSGWRPRPIAHAGIPVCYAARDPRDGTLWASLDHGHWGPKLSRSRDGGATWQDVTSVKLPKGARSIVKYLPTPDFDPESPTARPEYADATVYKIWTIAFSTSSQPDRLYAGTIPAGLFLSDHVNLSINDTMVIDRRTLSDRVPAEGTVYIFQALSGG